MADVTRTCSKGDCGKPHLTWHNKPSCIAHIAKGDNAGDPCRKVRAYGSSVCTSHGAGNPAVKKKNLKARELEAAEKAMRSLGLPRTDANPSDVLLEEVRWTAGHVQWLRGKVQELGEAANQLDGEHGLVWGTKQVTDKGAGQFTGTDTVTAAEPSVWYTLYTQERKHLVEVCTAALRAGVEERRVRLAEQQGDLVAEVIKRILRDLNLTPEQQTAVGTVVPRHLRAIAGGAS